MGRAVPGVGRCRSPGVRNSRAWWVCCQGFAWNSVGAWGGRLPVPGTGDGAVVLGHRRAARRYRCHSPAMRLRGSMRCASGFSVWICAPVASSTRRRIDCCKVLARLLGPQQNLQGRVVIWPIYRFYRRIGRFDRKTQLLWWRGAAVGGILLRLFETYINVFRSAPSARGSRAGGG